MEEKNKMKLRAWHWSLVLVATQLGASACVVADDGKDDDDDDAEFADLDAGDTESSESSDTTGTVGNPQPEAGAADAGAGGTATEGPTEDGPDAAPPEGDGGSSDVGTDGGWDSVTWTDAGGDAGNSAADGGDAETDLNLPPDPGAEGDESVEGIDSNDNIIRDDVERNIGFRYYPRRSLIDWIWRLAKLDQTMVLGVADPNVVSEAFDEKKLVLGCIAQELDGDIGELLTITGDVSAFIFNTGARLDASRQIESQLGGQVITLPTDAQIATYCGAAGEGPVSSQADSAQLCAAVGGTTVTLSNDAFNRHDKSLVHLMAIRDAAVAVGGDAATEYSYRLLYADSERLWLSSTTNPETLEGAESLGAFAAARVRADHDVLNRWLSGAGSIPDSLRPLVADSVVIEANDVVEESDVQGHVSGLTSDATVGNRIIAFGHGLGNLYLNAAYDQVIGSLPEFAGSMRGIALGTPAATVAGQTGTATHYVNLEGDWMLESAYAGLAAAPLAPNAQNTSNAADASGHELYFSYMTGDGSGSALRELLGTAFEEVEFPEGLGTNGIITVTLTWGEAPDVDLHAFEPDDTHVFYSTKIGTVGELDVDDTTQFGPEHYTVSCAKLVVGTYRIGVNYFSGSAPETAVVGIVAGTQSRTINVELDASRGSSGNATPVEVADIVVTEGAEAGSFVFSVRSISESADVVQ
jgi:hypothetical protein